MASYLYRTAQPPTLATFRPWGNSEGAGRIRLAGAKILNKCYRRKGSKVYLTIYIPPGPFWYLYSVGKKLPLQLFITLRFST